MTGILVDPHGRGIGFTDRPGRSTHDCRLGCRLHQKCCATDAKRMFDPFLRPFEHDADCRRRPKGR